jgi:hypothetical protein
MLLLLIFSLVWSSMLAITREEMYAFGPDRNDTTIPPWLEGHEVQLDIPFPFLGEFHQRFFLSRNGSVFFNGIGTSKDCTLNNTIAVFMLSCWAPYQEVYYRMTTDPSVLANARRDICAGFGDDLCDSVGGLSWVFVATWDGVYLDDDVDWFWFRGNRFQLVMVTDGTKSFVFFNYQRIMCINDALCNGMKGPVVGFAGKYCCFCCICF